MLAIVIPYYRIAFFKDTLQSLSKQSNKQFKVYIGDDASPENPDNIIDQFKDALEIHYVRFQDNLGQDNLVQHWERCLELVKDEEWVCLLGDDDNFEPEVIKEFYANLNKIKSGGHTVVRMASGLIDQHGQPTSDIFRHPITEKASEAYFKKFKALSRSSLSEYFFKLKAYQTIGFTEYPLAWCTDDKAWLDFSKKQLIFTINDAVVEVRRSGDNISSREDNLEAKERAKRQFYKDIGLKNNYGFSKKQKIEILLEYVQLLKKHSLTKTVHLMPVINQFVKLGDLYNAGRLFNLMLRYKP